MPLIICERASELQQESRFSQSQNQVRSDSSAVKTESRAGGVTKHGGSMSAERGFPSFNSLDIALQSSRQSAAEVIRNGSSSVLSQATAAKGINSDASSQVDPDIYVPGKG